MASNHGVTESTWMQSGQRRERSSLPASVPSQQDGNGKAASHQVLSVCVMCIFIYKYIL